MKQAGMIVDWHFHRNRIYVKVIGCTVTARDMWWRTIEANQLNQQWLAK